MDVPGWILGISIHALLAESDGILGRRLWHRQQFLSTLSLRRATILGIPNQVGTWISIHALLAESDTYPSQCRTFARDFYPRSPCGERPVKIKPVLISTKFLSTLSLRRATGKTYGALEHVHISIHALLAESDTYPSQCRTFARDFYPRSPCGERLPLRLELVRRLYHFYPRSPCGERPALKTIKALFDTISIHALLAESDNNLKKSVSVTVPFLSTLSLRRATTANRTDPSAILDFYPRSPCGERRRARSRRRPSSDFYPRSPCGERLCAPP